MMKKVLYYNTALLKGGTESYMLTTAGSLDKDKFEVSIIIKNAKDVDGQALFDAQKIAKDVVLFHEKPLLRLFAIKQYFKKHKNEFDIIHINATSQKTGIIAYYAKKYGKIPKVVFHSHMSQNDHKSHFLDAIGRKLFEKNADVFSACSVPAGIFMFGKKAVEDNKVEILKNPIDVKSFAFDVGVRNQTRQEMGTPNDTFVVLNVARFSIHKNHKKLVEVFAQVLKFEPNAELWLVGTGDLFAETQELAKSLGIFDKVRFLGTRSDVNKLLIAADCFVLSSLHEGFPISAIEAQASGIKTILASTISQEVKLASNVIYIDLDSPNVEWAKEILEPNSFERENAYKKIDEAGYGLQSANKKIETIYLN